MLSTAEQVTTTNGRENTLRVAYIISDHGLGHAARSCAIIEELLKREARVVAVTSAPRQYFEESLPKSPNFEYHLMKTDVGMHQASSVEIDLPKTVQDLEAFWSEMEGRVAALRRFLVDWKAHVVVYDIAALAVMAAEQAGLPAIAVTNFDWAYIYSGYLEQEPRFAPWIERHEAAYRKSRAWLRLPYSDDLPAFRGIPQTEIGILGRRSNASREETFRKLGIRVEPGVKYLLYSFGSHSFPIYNNFQQWQISNNWRVIWVEHNDALSLSRFPNMYILYASKMKELGVPYIDLLAAVDVVLCKTGYGTVMEALLNSKSVLYTDRPGFREHPHMVKALSENVNCAEVTVDEVVHLDHRLLTKADQISLNAKTPAKHLRFDGAAQAAQFILDEASKVQ